MEAGFEGIAAVGRPGVTDRVSDRPVLASAARPLLPGARMTEGQFAERRGVSRVPMRVAVQDLLARAGARGFRVPRCDGAHEREVPDPCVVPETRMPKRCPGWADPAPKAPLDRRVAAMAGGGFRPPRAGLEPGRGSQLTGSAETARTRMEERTSVPVFEDCALFPRLTVARNTGCGPMARGRPPTEILAGVAGSPEVVGPAGMETRDPARRSGGLRQRVALARAPICAPRLVLLDEPLAALDAGPRRQMQNSLMAVQRHSGITFAVVTREQDEAIELSDRIRVMSGGPADQAGTAHEVCSRPASRAVAAVFGDNT